jgi:hypothetical protein
MWFNNPLEIPYKNGPHIYYDPSMPQYPDGSSSNTVLWNTVAYLSLYITGRPYEISQVGFVEKWVLTCYTNKHHKCGCGIR